MPAWSAQNAIFKGDKVAAWTEFDQVPRHCRQKQLTEVEFVKCADDKALQKIVFEHKWQQLTFVPLNTVAADATLSTGQQQIPASIPAYAVKPASSVPATPPLPYQPVVMLQIFSNFIGSALAFCCYSLSSVG